MYDKVSRILGRVVPKAANTKPGVSTQNQKSSIYKSPIVQAYEAEVEARQPKNQVMPWTQLPLKDRVANMRSDSMGDANNDLVNIIKQYRSGSRTFPVNVQSPLSKIVKPFVAQITLNPKKK